SERINSVKQRVAEDIVVRRKLCLNSRHRDESTYPQVHAARNLRNIKIDVLQGRIKAILTMIVQQLAAEVAFRHPHGETTGASGRRSETWPNRAGVFRLADH